MKTFSALLALCAGNTPVTDEFPPQRPMTRSFDLFFDLSLNKLLSNNRDAGDLRRHRAHYDVTVMGRRPARCTKSMIYILYLAFTCCLQYRAIMIRAITKLILVCNAFIVSMLTWWPWQNAEPWWRHQMETFFALLALCAGNSPVPVNSPHKGQWRGALMFSLICVWINGWVNNREAGDLRRHRGHYAVIA